MVNERKSNCQTLEYDKYTNISPKFRLLLLTQHLGDAKNVVITERILKYLQMLVFGKKSNVLTTHKFVRIQDVY